MHNLCFFLMSLKNVSDTKNSVFNPFNFLLELCHPFSSVGKFFPRMRSIAVSVPLPWAVLWQLWCAPSFPPPSPPLFTAFVFLSTLLHVTEWLNDAAPAASGINSFFNLAFGFFTMVLSQLFSPLSFQPSFIHLYDMFTALFISLCFLVTQVPHLYCLLRSPNDFLNFSFDISNKNDSKLCSQSLEHCFLPFILYFIIFFFSNLHKTTRIPRLSRFSLF